MTTKLNGEVLIESLTLGVTDQSAQAARVIPARALELNESLSAVLSRQVLAPRRDVFELSGEELEILAANDYGSIELGTWPEGHFAVIGARVNLVAGGATGGLSGALAALDCALGAVATSTVDFSNSDEDLFLQKIDSTGTGRIRGASESAAAFVPLTADGSTQKLMLNFSNVIGSDGTANLTGKVEITYFDLGATDG